MNILYINYWGAAEPLGQSLMVPAVKRLASLGCNLTVVTFEKPSDLNDRKKISALAAELASAGIRWIPLKYHKSPKIPATAFDMTYGLARSVLSRLRQRYDIVHGRTFIGGLIGQAVAAVLGAKFVYHNEGFYPDEQVDGGVWRAGSRPHRIALKLERQMYERADGIIALSHRACEQIQQLGKVKPKKAPVVFVPSCVDLDLFDTARQKASQANGKLRLSYIGSVGYRYLFHSVARFVAQADRVAGPVDFRVLTRHDHGQIRSMLADAGLPESRWTLEEVPHAKMPGELAERDAGLFFLTTGTSEHGCSPTKIGEYWACGLPVVTTPNVSDTDRIVQEDRIGVVVKEHSDDEYRRCAIELKMLLQDPDLPTRCRDAAEQHYALAPACQRQVELYQRIIEEGCQ